LGFFRLKSNFGCIFNIDTGRSKVATQTTTSAPDIPWGVVSTTTETSTTPGTQTALPQEKKEAAKSRPLTAGEVAMAKLIFKDAIDYSKVKVHNEGYLPFGLQKTYTAMTPNGEIYFNPEDFKDDFSLGQNNDKKHWIMHEMVHVWQHQLGYPVLLRGAIRFGVPYEYDLAQDKSLSDYNMEAQGDLLADYFALKFLNDASPLREAQLRYSNDLPLYEQVLKNFLANPKDASNLPGGNATPPPRREF
jgi:hypothetical protein